MLSIALVTALFAQVSALTEQKANSSLIEDAEFPQHKAFENGIASSTYPTAFPTPPPTPMPTPNPTLMPTPNPTESQYCRTLDNGCPETMPNRYPANNRCFEKVWGGNMCNVDPANDPLAYQRNDKKCCTAAPAPTQYCKKLDNGCPEATPNRYPGNNRCFERVWGGSMCNVDPANDPLSFQRNDKKCCSCFPALGGGQKLENGCPASIPFRYPNNNRCFAKMWEGYSCNVDPANDPLAFQRSDQKCCFD